MQRIQGWIFARIIWSALSFVWLSSGYTLYFPMQFKPDYVAPEAIDGTAGTIQFMSVVLLDLILPVLQTGVLFARINWIRNTFAVLQAAVIMLGIFLAVENLSAVNPWGVAICLLYTALNIWMIVLLLQSADSAEKTDSKDG